jgi:hypothetical protein
MYTPPQWRIAFPIVLAAIVLLAIGFVFAWRGESIIGMAATAGVIIGLILAIAWALRRFLPILTVILVAIAAATLGALGLHSPEAAIGAAATAAAVVLLWIVYYDVWFSGRHHREHVSDVTRAGGSGDAGRALIVYHSHSGFQAAIQRALTEGLQSSGWQVDITTASHATPTDLRPYGLLVLGAPSFNWVPARPITDYLDRLGSLAGKPVLLVVSGGGMTDRALRTLRRRVTRAGGRIVSSLEIWTTRLNRERYGVNDPGEIMRRAGAELRITTGGSS